MARNCPCSQGTSTKIVPGDGIELTGSGTPSDPYEISATVTSFAAAFQALDTQTLTLDLIGSGTVTDPFILRGEASLSMQQLTDWDDPGGLNIGDVPVWLGDHWEAAPPPTVPPGAVTAGDGLLGDGTLVDPIRVAVSDTTTTSTAGLAIYVDSAGELRAVAQSIANDRIVSNSTTTNRRIVAADGATPFAFQTVASGTATNVLTVSATGVIGVATIPWGQVTGKPTTFPPAAHVHDVTEITAFGGSNGSFWTWLNANLNAKVVKDGVTDAGIGWNGALPTIRIDSSTMPMATQSLLSAVQSGLQTNIDSAWTLANNAYSLASGKANAWGGDANLVRYTEGPSTTAYNRSVAGSGFFAVWMDAGLQFGRNVSARKYKTDISPYSIDPADVLALEPVKYTLVSSPEAGEQFGLIADDVALRVPEIVVFENGEPETIRYDLLAVALLDVVKVQEERIVALEKAAR